MGTCICCCMGCGDQPRGWPQGPGGCIWEDSCTWAGQTCGAPIWPISGCCCGTGAICAWPHIGCCMGAAAAIGAWPHIGCGIGACRAETCSSLCSIRCICCICCIICICCSASTCSSCCCGGPACTKACCGCTKAGAAGCGCMNAAAACCANTPPAGSGGGGGGACGDRGGAMAAAGCEGWPSGQLHGCAPPTRCSPIWRKEGGATCLTSSWSRLAKATLPSAWRLRARCGCHGAGGSLPRCSSVAACAGRSCSSSKRARALHCIWLTALHGGQRGEARQIPGTVARTPKSAERMAPSQEGA
mmetsp:Transcript_79448/g.171699  ORF Transcript_79448/g.171699 Transcript_79448/m.171699 type:complete len:302 (-) Transcript_79448:2-907(-)